MKPFLFQFSEKAGSPPEAELNSDYYFDEEDDLLYRKDQSDNLPAIEIEGEEGPRTKKHDVEKGDDNKDDGMWL
ncbi:hypothetical protein [Halostella pelagica]|uniref:hypothetical protein n=1 Tax=Halostella pelagica TaxID=2583824 RepID=UPI00108078C4|nr:hypothetical protein [Halostella pelagica]